MKEDLRLPRWTPEPENPDEQMPEWMEKIEKGGDWLGLPLFIFGWIVALSCLGFSIWRAI